MKVSIKFRVLIPVLVVTSVLLTAIIALAYFTTSAEVEKLAFKQGESLSSQFGAYVDSEMEVAMDSARAFTWSFIGLRRAGIQNREAYAAVLEDGLKGGAARFPFLAIWTVWEPGAFGDDPTKVKNDGLRLADGRFAVLYVNNKGNVRAGKIADDFVKGESYLSPIKEKIEYMTGPMSVSYTGDAKEKTRIAS
ncbi:MAG: hypothetical protein WCT14_21305, partial [Treponemataceae bacterium]